MLEPDASKGARPVLRGGGAGDITYLPDAPNGRMAQCASPGASNQFRRRSATDSLAPSGSYPEMAGLFAWQPFVAHLVLLR